MKQALKLLFFLALAGCSAWAQNVVSTTLTGTACVSVNVTGRGVVGISITNSGTAWSGTIQPEVAIGGDAPQDIQVTPSTSSTAQSTITANGVYQAFVTGATTFLLCGNTVTNTAGVKMQASSLAAGGHGGGGSGVSGVPTRASACTGNVDTILSTDRAGYVSENDASACAVTLPQAGSTGFTSNFVFGFCDQGAGTATITPTVSTITTFAGGAPTTGNTSAAFTQGQCGTFYSDNTNYILVYKGGTSYPDITDTSGTLITFGVPTAYPAGTAASAAIQRTGTASTGLHFPSTLQLCFAAQGDTCDITLSASTSGFAAAATLGHCWSSSTSDSSSGVDTCIYRDSTSGIIDFGSSSQRTTTSKLKASGYMSVGTKFTTSNGCGESTNLTGGATAGVINTSGSTSCSTVVTMGDTATAPNGGACNAYDLTTAGDYAHPSVAPTSATTITITTGTIVSGDHIQFSCIGY